jgi:type VI secretion system protein VasJ
MPDTAYSIDEDLLSSLLASVEDHASEAGYDPFEDDLFQDVLDEIRRLVSEGAGRVRWETHIIDPATRLLREVGKDLRLATYLALAWTHTAREPMDGLANGLILLDGLLRTYPVDLHPHRQDFRVKALNFLTERAVLRLAQDEPAGSRVTAYRRLRTALETYRTDQADELCRPLGKLDDHLSDFEERLRIEAPEQFAPPPAVPPAAEHVPAPPLPLTEASRSEVPPQAVSANGTTSPEKPASPRIVAEMFEEWAVAEAASLRAANPLEVRAFALLRAGLWTGLSRAQGAAKGTISAHGTAPQTERQEITQLLTAREWPVLLSRVEEQLPKRRYWLDLNRYADMALAEMQGDAAAAARRAIRGAVANLLIRLPDLPQMRDNNNNPLADDETRRWCAELVASGLGDADPVDAVLADGRGRRKTAKPKELMALFTSPPVSVLRQGREWFRWRLAQAQLAAECNLLPQALALSDELAAEAGAMSLDRWEPALALTLHRLRLRCFTHGDVAKLRPEAERRAEQARSQAILFRLDPVGAVDGNG